MISSGDFDHFLKRGFITGIPLDTSMDVLLSQYGDDYWYIKNTELNGLIYGIIKIGLIEFHIYNERVSGISYRPDQPFPKKDFAGVDIPWIYKSRSIDKIENELATRKINYNKYSVNGPLKNFDAAGVKLFGLEDGEHTFIDTEGGVSFLFEDNIENGQLKAYQVCKYCDIMDKSNQMIS